MKLEKEHAKPRAIRSKRIIIMRVNINETEKKINTRGKKYQQNQKSVL